MLGYKMKKGFFLLVFLCILSQLKAQDQYTISGIVFDESSSDRIELASVRILNAKDSTYVNGTVTDSLGRFRISLKPARYVAQVSFMGYTDKYISVNATKGNVALGNIALSDNGVLLGEAVVTGRIVEMQVKGDTIEYNADAYKVQQSAVVEDLLKKMPGVEIDSDGKITVNGKEVKKMLVDGKEFFSDDPKVASKNLPAAMVEKLQVVDRKSEMAQMTGFDDGNEETIINLSIRPGMKEGIFGNGFAGYGNKERYEAGGMVNYMRNDTQISALGGVNNTNNAGFSDFASNMFSGNRPSRGGMGFGGGNGVAKTLNGGVNFATEYSDKLKYGGDIRYGTVDNDVSSTSNRINTGLNQTEVSKSQGNNTSNNLGLNMRFEWTPDSLTTVVFRPSFQYNTNDNTQSSVTDITNVSQRFGSSYNTNNYYSTGKGINLNGDLDISRKLNNKGRVLSIGLTGGLSNANSDGSNYINSSYQYVDTSKQDSISSRDQIFTQDDKSYNWRVYVSYVEPLGRSNFLQLSYNIRNNNSQTDKETFLDDGSKTYTIVDNDYTRYVKNDFINQNISLNFKSVRQKFNYTLGLGVEPSSSKTTVEEPLRVVDAPRKNFLSVVPVAQFNYMWDRRHNLRIDYRGNTNQPTALQLFSGIISSDAVNTTYGNPDLRPSFENRVSLRYSKFNSESASMYMLRGDFRQTSNDIVTVTQNLINGGKDIRYENINGNFSGNLRFIMNSPLRNKKFSVNSMSYASYSKSNTFISSFSDSRQKNTADIYTLTERMGISFRSDVLDFTMGGNFSYNNLKNSISSQKGQETFNYGGSGDMTLYLPMNFTVQSDLAYSTNSGYSDGYKQEEWLWNASLAKDIFKAKNGTIRFKIYDILQQRSNISRTSNATYIQDVTTNTINSYFMVHFVYKFQLFKGGVKRSDMERDPRDGGGPRRDGGGYRGGGGRGPGMI